VGAEGDAAKHDLPVPNEPVAPLPNEPLVQVT
jgi:hypothetical protein